MIKKITGGFGTVQSERKGKDSYMAETRARLVIAANALPPFSDASNAIFRRLVLIGMDVNFSERQDVNRNLSAEIVAAEMSGILNWALRGLAMVQRGNDPFGLAIVKERRAEYRQEADCVHRFVKENIVKDDACEILLGALYTRVFRPYLDDLGAARRGRSKLQKAIEELTRARYVMIRTATGKRPEVMRGCRYIGDYAEWPINHPVGIDDDADVSAALDGVPF